MSVPSNTTRPLTKKEVNELSSEIPTEEEEWLIARCGNWSSEEKQTFNDLLRKNRQSRLSGPEKLLFDRMIKEEFDLVMCRGDARRLERVKAFATFLLGPDKSVSYVPREKERLDIYKNQLGKKIATWCNHNEECFKGMWEILINSPFKLNFPSIVLEVDPIRRFACEGYSENVGRCVGHLQAQIILHEITGRHLIEN